MKKWAIPLLTLAAAASWGVVEFDWSAKKTSRTHRSESLQARESEQTIPLRYTNSGTIGDTRLNEVSGMVASRRHPGVYWVLNDSGNRPDIYAIDEHGKLLGTWPIVDAVNRDWEDIAVDERGSIIIADTGSDGRGAGAPLLLEVNEPSDLDRPAALTIRSTWAFRFPDPERDCEALFEWRGSRYVLEKKGTVEKPARRPIRLFRLRPPNTPSHAISTVPAHTESYTFRAPVTAADISVDGKSLAVLTSTALYVFDRADVEGPFLTPGPRVIPFEFDHAESVAFHHDGSGDVLIVTEGRSIYRVSAL